MIDAYRIQDVRDAEAAALAQLPDGELMRRAADGLAQVVSARVAEFASGAGKKPSVVALVGSGDNGGDALYALAALAGSAGVKVKCTAVLLGSAVHEQGLAAAVAAGVATLTPEGEPEKLAKVLARASVVLDAVVGIGGRPGLAEDVARLRTLIGEGAHVIAVDLPSGADPAGEQAADCIWADETVTFGVAKPVHLSPVGEPGCGVLTIIDLGIEPVGQPAVQRLDRDDVAALWPVPGPYDDKYSRGVLGIVCGSERFPGAAVLSATAAASAGVGMIRYIGPGTPTDLLRAAVPEAVTGTGRVQAYVVGSGVAADDRTAAGRAQLRQVTAALDSDLPCVVDAGALEVVGARSAPTLLTPHAGELARLAARLKPSGLPRGRRASHWSDLVAQQPMVVARAVADHLGATVLLKGAVTVVVPPSGSESPIRSQADGSPWLATAGSGDVLAGLAGTLLASGLSPLDAGSAAAAVHGYAADHANPGGPVRALAVAHALGPTVAALLARPR
ncbi:bifunctional ADP-dependent NAD(P)H-hydrate dehydratase/NAD(P)H-hydrate epimerase [Dermacoccaceae bacterium W4C1]